MITDALRVLVCGSRTFSDDSMIHALLDGLWAEYTVGYMVADMHGMTLIEGGAKGADAAASWWAENSPMHAHGERGEDDPPFEHLCFPADWVKNGKAAGPIRNQLMIEGGRPNLCVAFIDKPLAESRGTADMVRRSLKAGVRTVVVQDMNPPTEMLGL